MSLPGLPSWLLGVNGTIINIHNDDIRAALSNADGKDKAIVDTLLNVVPSISGQYMMLSEQNTKLSDLNLKLSDLNSKLADQNESLTSELVAANKSIEQLSKDLMEGLHKILHWRPTLSA